MLHNDSTKPAICRPVPLFHVAYTFGVAHSVGMYASHGFLQSDIGDVDVIYHDGLYHLFHLVLPNHDFIAHAVSKDGMTWRRVRNALFVGDPGTWDDDMLWTMHVTADPEHEGSWRGSVAKFWLDNKNAVWQRV